MRVSERFRFSSIAIAIMVLILSHGCNFGKGDQKIIENDDQKNKANTNVVMPNEPIIRTSEISPKARESAEKTQWIMDPIRISTFTDPLLTFFKINERFPYDVKEYLVSGLPIAWPIVPSSGLPMSVTDEPLKPSLEHTGNIRYVRNSDTDAYFEYIDTDYETHAFIVRRFPTKETITNLISEIEDSKHIPKNILSTDCFRKQITDLSGLALLKPEFRFDDITPKKIDEMTDRNFLLLKENLAPKFISADPLLPLFIEAGTATYQNMPVSYYYVTYTIITPVSHQEQIDHLVFIEPLKDSTEWWSEQTDYDSLSNKLIFYSTSQMLDSGMNYPDDSLISIDEIVN